MSIQVYDPRGTRESAAFTLAPRPKKKALTLGVLDNSKEQADVLLARAAELLRADNMTAVFARKPSFSRPAPGEVIEQLKMCDLVITGLGG
ncbi:MAG TPA: hypothetical protein VN905_15175 [Candidatus Binatia bacterium]|nr:hypothetical protein [Candidatus Binatia bacterium]